MSDVTLDLSFIPISSLKNASRNVLSMLLNPTKIIPSDDGVPRDWRGLAHLSGISGEMIPGFFSSADPTSGVLSQWSQKGVQIANLRRLQEYLGKMDRFDVFDDTRHLFESDAMDYLNDSRSSSISSISPSMLPSTPEHDVLTVDDAYLSQQGSLSPQIYDAFVLFADEDTDFALELIDRMEAFGFKLCVKDRDLLGGLSSQHSAMLRLISERCNRLIVIISPAFLQSPANTFFIDFAQALGIEQRQRKIVPCLYKYCQLPPQLSYYFLLNYQRSGKLWNFWDKLRDSLRVTPISLTSNQRAIIREIETDVQTLSIGPTLHPYQPSPRLAIPSAPAAFKPQYAIAASPVQPPTISVTLSEPEDEPKPSTKPPAILPSYLPPIGLSTSMVNLNQSTDSRSEQSFTSTTDPEMFVSANDITDISANNHSNSKTERTKKGKWYQKFLTFNHHNSSSRSLSSFDQNDTSVKKKKKWHLKKAVPVLAD